MAEEKKEKRKLIRRLKSRYRLVIMNDETLEEKASFNLRPLNVFVATGLTVIMLIILTTILIAFTNLREYIPGYADVKMKRQLYVLALKSDSMQTAIDARDAYIENIKAIVTGNIKDETPDKKNVQLVKVDSTRLTRKSKDDSLLRVQIEKGDAYSLSEKNNSTFANDISGFLFFPPMKGTVTNRFDATNKHFGIDIAGNSNEAIKATLDGTVVLANFTSETGYVIGIMHTNNLFSFYKHNSALLKKSGDYVKAGEVIAIIGNSGELSTGPHLHFELWYNGNAIDAQRFISF